MTNSNQATEATFSLDERTEMSREFSRGNYANAYGEEVRLDALDEMSEHERAAFVLGYFSSYELDEIPFTDREIYDECYWSPAGRYVVRVAGYCDSRDDEYRAESGD